MWYIFPTTSSLRHSRNAEYYGNIDRDEAIMFLLHPLLGRNLYEITMAILTIDGKSAEEILGGIDALKFRSSMTLFDNICPNDIFSDALQKYYDGKSDERTLEMLQTSKVKDEQLISGGIIGAIIGDIVGSFYEFCNHKSTNIALFTMGTQFTDDTVMTIAVADWL